MIDVAVNGYGTIGKRVADAVAAQGDMRVVGVAKTTPNHEARRAVDNGYPLYAAVEDRMELFEQRDVPLEGHVSAMLDEAEVVVDATPSGIGEQNRELYEEHGVKALFQGGEDADVAEKSFNAAANYGDCRGADSLRVVSCNTTGLLRLLHPLDEEYGVGSVQATLVRRGGDPSQHGRGPINDILPNPVELPSHHGPDVETVMPELDIFTAGFKVPATLMHVHHVAAEVDASRGDVLDTLGDRDRVLFVSAEDGVSSTAEVKEMMLDRGRPRGDCWENAVWRDSVTVEDGVLHLFQAIHQESDVVPENVDAIRAAADAAPRDDSVRTTNETLGIPLS